MSAKWLAFSARFLPTLFLPVLASPFASAAESYGLPNEALVTVTGQVVDVACEVAGDCVPNCGDGRRSLGLKTSDGKLLLAAKGAADFMGTIHDLLPYCGKTIIVDGLTTTNFGATLLMVQRTKTSESASWQDADQNLRDWAAANGVAPDSDAANTWVRNDAAVKAAVAKRGRLGIPE